MRRRPSTSARKEGEAAFTLVEAAASIAIIALLSIIGLVAIVGASKAVLHTKEESAFLSRLLHLETVLRRQAALVEIPFWSAKATVHSSPTMIEAAYFKGDPAANLRLSIVDDFVTIETAETREHMGPFPGISVSPLISSDQREIGISLNYPNDGRAVELKAVFSAVSLPQALE